MKKVIIDTMRTMGDCLGWQPLGDINPEPYLTVADSRRAMAADRQRLAADIRRASSTIKTEIRNGKKSRTK